MITRIDYKTNSIQGRLERAILGVCLSDKTRSRVTRHRLELKDLIHHVLIKKWLFANKLCRSERSWARIEANWIPEEKQRKGKPRTRWLDNIARYREREHYSLYGIKSGIKEGQNQFYEIFISTLLKRVSSNPKKSLLILISSFNLESVHFDVDVEHSPSSSSEPTRISLLYAHPGDEFFCSVAHILNSLSVSANLLK